MMTFFPAPRPAKWPPELNTEKARHANDEMTADSATASAKKAPELNTEKGSGAIEEIRTNKS
jgi:hypothetical protein